MEQTRRRVTKKNLDGISSYQKLCERFPDKIIRRRIINEGQKNEKVIEYIPGNKVIERLNDCLGMDWSFTVVDKIIDIDIGQIAVLGSLSAKIRKDDGTMIEVTKEQWGSSVVETYANGQVICLGDNIKAATTDALKKCAVQIGVGLYLYDNDDPTVNGMNYVAPGTVKKDEMIKKVAEETNEKCSKAQVSTILKIIRDNELSADDVKTKYEVEKFSDMSKADAAEFIIKWKEIFVQKENNESE